jgi:putative flavoprotein involved in K+ transport|eukprot:COSAG01_NODE_1857_length_9044_cov_24.006931_5_plen_59_part_00
MFLAGPQVRQAEEIFCFVYKYRQRFAVVVNEVATRLGINTSKAVAKAKRQKMFLADAS